MSSAYFTAINQFLNLLKSKYRIFTYIISYFGAGLNNCPSLGLIAFSRTSFMYSIASSCKWKTFKEVDLQQYLSNN